MLAGVLSTSSLDLLAYAPPGWGATLLHGLWNSILIAIGSYALGLTIGIGGAYGKLYGSPLTKDLLGIYTTVVRAVPEVVLILILYFAVTDAINGVLLNLGYDRIEISGVAAGIAVLGVVQGAYATRHGHAGDADRAARGVSADAGLCHSGHVKPVADRDQGYSPAGGRGLWRTDARLAAGSEHDQGVFHVLSGGGGALSDPVHPIDSAVRAY
jgi:His/Glu/Gln/Arg/opine family amino acid ABC transporter permease subunit